MDIEALTRHYGYPVIFFGTMFQGEAVLLLGGFLAHQGYLSPWLVWLVAAFSAVSGDATYFELGRHAGDKILKIMPTRVRHVAESLRRVVGQHPNQIMLSMRFLFGTRILLPLLCGMAPISTRRFLLMNAMTGAIWSGTFIGVGYLFGVAARSVIGDLEHAEIFFLVAIVAIAAAYHWFSRMVRRRRQAGSDRLAP